MNPTVHLSTMDLQSHNLTREQALFISLAIEHAKLCPEFASVNGLYGREVLQGIKTDMTPDL
jgi:hypothetical protein